MADDFIDKPRIKLKGFGEKATNPLVDYLNKTYPRNPLDPREFVIDEEAAITVVPRGKNRAYVNSIRAFEKRTGSGTRVLDLLGNLADKFGTTLEGFAEPFGQGGPNKKQLIEIYKKRGWVEPPKGQEVTGSGTLFREPRPTERSNLPALLDAASTASQLPGGPDEPRPKGKLRRGIGSLRKAPWFALAQMAWSELSPEQREAVEDYAKQAYERLEAGEASLSADIEALPPLAYSALPAPLALLPVIRKVAAAAQTRRRDFPMDAAGGLEWVKDFLGFGDQESSGVISLPDLQKYVATYHGGPSEWAPEPGYPEGRPLLEKIGTGEGVQAYGHGVYFAEAEGVARTYKRGSPDDALGVGRSRSALYQIDIPEADAANLLDWDKPLSEQSESVRKALDQRPGPGQRRLASTLQIEAESRGMNYNDLTGQDMHEFLSAMIPEKEVADILRKAGIPGLKFLDQFSRDHKNLYKGKSLVKKDGKALSLNEDWQQQGSEVLQYLVDNNMDMNEFISQQREVYGQKGKISRALGGVRQQLLFLDILEGTTVQENPLTRNYVIWDQGLLDQLRTVRKEAAGGFIDKPLYEDARVGGMI